MSLKKDKLIESATKFIVKGQIDKAIKDYEQIVALDPNDLRNRQKLAELLVRVSRKQEAIEEFEKIGKYYANNAYYLKAIAVYKQVQKLDPSVVSVSLTLAELNVKQGLEGNAIAEYNLALAAYEREGDQLQMVKIYDAMLAAYPENPNLRLKAAEFHLAIGKVDQSYQEFTELALIMQRKGNELAFQQVCEKIQQHFPQHSGFNLHLGESFLAKGDASGALKWLQKAVEQDRQNLKVWDQYVAALKLANAREQLLQAYHEMLLLFPTNPDPCEGIIIFAIEDCQYEEALSLLTDMQERFFAAQRLDAIEQCYQRLLDSLPSDLRVLHGLRDIYTLSGNTDGLADIDAKITKLASNQHLTVDYQAEPEEEVPEESEITIEATRHEWEDTSAVELDLSSLEEDIPFEIESTSQVEPEPAAIIAPVPPPAESDFAVNWESEGLDLGEIELVGGPLEGLEAIPEEVPLPVAAPGKKKQSVRVGEQLEDSDTETHYSLGIAYKEMGLYDEAIKSFQIAALSTVRKVDCMTLQGLCMRDKGDYAAAEEAFTRVLKISAAPDELICARYELAELNEHKGNADEALRLYREVVKTDPEYREVQQKIAALDKGSAGAYLSDQLFDLVSDHDD